MSDLHHAGNGYRHWAVAEGYLAEPTWVVDEQADAVGENLSHHETLFFLNAGEASVAVSLSIYLADEERLGPYHFTVEPRRTCQVSLAELEGPHVPRGKDFASLIESDLPIVVLATKRRTARSTDAPLTKIAFSG